MNILIVTPQENIVVTVSGLLAIGGRKGSGQRLASLAKEDDYLVVSPTASGALSIVPLKGKERTPRELRHLERFQIEDLWIMPLPVVEKNVGTQKTVDLSSAIADITQAPDDKSLAATVLTHVLQLTGFDRGLIIGKNAGESFEVLTHLGTDPSAPWLSESLLQETLSGKNPVVVPNLIGSRFEKNMSLVGTGFLAVAAWPLTWQGEVVGAIVAGSPFPRDAQSMNDSGVAMLAPYVAQYVASWLREKRLEKKLARLEKNSQDDSPFLTQSKSLQDMMALARRVAPSDLSLLIQGETGVGKEVLAKWLHTHGPGQKGSLIAVNCGAIPENLIESTLFGHKKGSFTGAIADQTGKFVLAHGGTLFLDEVADLPLSVQGKLLRALQERSVEPVGSTRPISVQVRVICATHKDLQAMVEKGTFREDLYYRLAEVTLEIPPLRLRPQDAILIAQDYLAKNDATKKISAGCWEWIQTQRWSGNVRELLSSLRRAQLLAQGPQIEVRDFVVPSARNNDTKSWLGANTLDEACRKFQNDKVRIALQMTDGNRKDAAELLGVTSRTLFRYLEDIREVQP
jgi:two-component system, NtrC family, response regulator